MQQIKTLFIIIVSILFFLTACSTATPINSSMELEPSLRPSTRLLIRSANLKIEVNEPKFIIKKIKKLVKSNSGYIDNIYEQDNRRLSMTVKIPEKNLDSFIEKTSSMGYVISQSLSVRDVTEEMIDIEAKLTNLKVLRNRFRKLLDMAKNVSEVLKIEIELSRIQSEIDSIEARKKSLKNQVALSSVNIVISKKITYGPLGYLGKGFYWFIEKLFIIE